MNESPDTSQHANRDKKPSSVKQAIGKVTAALRADRDMREVLDAFSALNPNAIEKCSVEEARRQPTPADAVKSLLRKDGRSSDPHVLVPDIRSEERSIPGATCALRARIYRPQNAVPTGIIVYFHGGGWVIADLEVYDGGARGLASTAQAILVSVDYRRAPEHPFPAAWDDAFAAYRWVAEHASELGGDGRCLALAGESAGGCLALATAIAARDAGLATPRHVLTVYPVAQTGSLNTPSYLENAMAAPLNREMIKWFIGHLFREPSDLRDPRIDLVSADLAGLPPVTIINASLDPLRSDGAMLEDALREARVPVERKDYHGVTHEFFGMSAVVAKAREAQHYAGERLRTAFAMIGRGGVS